MSRNYWCMLVLGLLLQEAGFFLSSWAGAFVLFDFGALLVTASVGVLPGLLVVLIGGMLVSVAGDGRFFMLPFDFLTVLLFGFFLRRGVLRSWRNMAGAAVGLSVFLAVLADGVCHALNYKIPAESLAQTVSGQTAGAVFLLAEVGILALLISVNLFLDFFLIRLILDRFPGLVKRSLIEPAWGWGRVRQWPLRLKFVAVLSVMMLLAGSALFFLLRGVYREEVYGTYGSLARNYASAAKGMITPDELEAVLAPRGDRSRDYQELKRDFCTLYEHSDHAIRFLYVHQVIRDETGPAMRVICEADNETLQYDDRIPMRSAYYRPLKKALLDENTKQTIGPVVTNDPKWGWLLSVYEPLMDESGNTVAYIGVDLDMRQVMDEVYKLDAKIISVECIIFCFLLAFVYTFITNQVIRPIIRLQEMLSYFREFLEKKPSEPPIRSGDELEELYKEILLSQDKILDDTRQLREYLNLIERMALRDELTGVKNHTAYEQKIVELTAAILAGTAEFGVLMADMNELKYINDVYGHEKGDVALKAVSKALCTIFAHSPVYRIGGDEFVVVLTGQDYAAHQDLLLRMKPYIRLHDRTAEHPWEMAAMAAGFAVYRQGDTYADVFNRADERMYENKNVLKAGGKLPRDSVADKP